jgi:hypothetical protein
MTKKRILSCKNIDSGCGSTACAVLPAHVCCSHDAECATAVENDHAKGAGTHASCICDASCPAQRNSVAPNVCIELGELFDGQRAKRFQTLRQRSVAALTASAPRRAAWDVKGRLADMETLTSSLQQSIRANDQTGSRDLGELGSPSLTFSCSGFASRAVECER